ncbi:hypothetical protein SAMN03159358_2193 [Paenibacillus sp. NFR01]|nr:hypothetical protein SAMN03159358_2193 [Paenibacillus sp. NFR01]
MNLNEITLGMRVRITAGHWAGRTGFIRHMKDGKAVIDICEPLLISELPEHLEPAPDDPLLPGWAEYDV